MSALPLPDDFPQRDLIDRIANGLPANVRADYYRELMHCRALPESDEMLHILRIYCSAADLTPSWRAGWDELKARCTPD